MKWSAFLLLISFWFGYVQPAYSACSDIQENLSLPERDSSHQLLQSSLAFHSIINRQK
jgi:hypothetical protein